MSVGDPIPRSLLTGTSMFVYHETIKRKLNRRLIYECRWDEGLKDKTETRLMNESFASVMGECDLDATGAPSIFNEIRSSTSLARRFPHSDFIWKEHVSHTVVVKLTTVVLHKLNS